MVTYTVTMIGPRRFVPVSASGSIMVKGTATTTDLPSSIMPVIVFGTDEVYYNADPSGPPVGSNGVTNDVTNDGDYADRATDDKSHA